MADTSVTMNDAGRAAFLLACEVAGNQTVLAQKLGRPKSTVARWRREGVPQKDCAAVERITGIRCEALRPDLDWPPRKQPRGA